MATQNPKSKAVWILDFGSGILDCRSIRSFCGSPKAAVWILDLGFRILDFVSGLDFA